MTTTSDVPQKIFVTEELRLEIQRVNGKQVGEVKIVEARSVAGMQHLTCAALAIFVVLAGVIFVAGKQRKTDGESGRKGEGEIGR
ncbi:MAG: hypothetical protein ONB44_20265 [candidate division KSB1 bacterium]|nr:hypothetical protein [candidate division KSB1 bacterium]